MKKIICLVVMCIFFIGVSAFSGESEFKKKLALAKQGDANAQNILFFMYSNGNGVTKNVKEAIKWLRKSAEQGHAKAQFKLGLMYKIGDGVTQNYKEAFKWFKKSAEQGHGGAQFELGDMYFTGKGVTQNYIKAYIWTSFTMTPGNEPLKKKLQMMADKITIDQAEEVEKQTAVILEKLTKKNK